MHHFDAHELADSWELRAGLLDADPADASISACLRECAAALRNIASPAPAPEVPAGPRTEFVLNELRSALSAMTTFFGMDEDEASKPTFDKARQALNYAEIVMRPLEPWERQSLDDFRACVHRWHEKAVAKGYDGVEAMCDTALPYGTPDLRLVSASPAVAHQGGVDCIGLALDLEARAKTVESQTTERAMKAAAHGLRLLASSQTHAVAHGDGDANDMRSPTDHIDIAVALLETWARGDPAPLDRADARPVVIARLQSARAAIQASGIDAKP